MYSGDKLSRSQNKKTLEDLKHGDLGNGVYHLYECVRSMGNDNIFVDCGVAEGYSSTVFLMDSEKHNNKVYGIDVGFRALWDSVSNHPNYNKILGDTSTIGKKWNNGEISILLIDSVHVAQQTMVELYFWYKHVKEGGIIAFHDTQWEGYIHKPSAPDAGYPPGSSKKGYDDHGGRKWPTVDKGVKDFFNIDDLNYEDDFIKSTHNPEDMGFTIIEKKKTYNYIGDIDNWDSIFEDRNFLINYFCLCHIQKIRKNLKK